MSCSPSLHDIPFPLGFFYFCGLIVTDFLSIGKMWYYTEMFPFHLRKLVILTGLPKGFFFSQSPLFHNLITVPSLKASRNLFFSNSRPPTNFLIFIIPKYKFTLPFPEPKTKISLFPSFLSWFSDFFIIRKIYPSFKNVIPTQFFPKNPLKHIGNPFFK